MWPWQWQQTPFDKPPPQLRTPKYLDSCRKTEQNIGEFSEFFRVDFFFLLCEQRLSISLSRRNFGPRRFHMFAKTQQTGAENRAIGSAVTRQSILLVPRHLSPAMRLVIVSQNASAPIAPLYNARDLVDVEKSCTWTWNFYGKKNKFFFSGHRCVGAKHFLFTHIAKWSRFLP